MLHQPNRSTLSFNEIVFEHRNKEYGAFELRRSLERHQFIAFLITSSLVLIIVGGMFINGTLTPVIKAPYIAPDVNTKILEFYTQNEEIAQEESHKPSEKPSGRNDLKKDELVMVPVKDPLKETDKKDESNATDSTQFNAGGDGSAGPVKPGGEAGQGSGNGLTGNGNTNENEPIDIAEINPEFPGGLDKMYRYLGNNLRYPRYLLERKISGTVFVSFVVSKSGEINEVEIIKTPHEGFNEEVIRVIHKMPKWKPGFQGGKPVAVRYKMPIKFTLRD